LVKKVRVGGDQKKVYSGLVLGLKISFVKDDLMVGQWRGWESYEGVMRIGSGQFGRGNRNWIGRIR
jgi:hypothetical protein